MLYGGVKLVLVLQYTLCFGFVYEDIYCQRHVIRGTQTLQTGSALIAIVDDITFYL